MKKITIITSRSGNLAETSPNAHRRALAEGFSRIGIESIYAAFGQEVTTRHVACWGWKIGKKLRQQGHEVLVLERGYLGDRFRYTSLGWNGLNGHATFPDYPNDGGKRFLQHSGREISPWKKHGRYVLILGQVRNDASLQGKDIGEWYRQKAQEAHKFYKLPVFFRPHPEAGRRGGYSRVADIKNAGGTLAQAFEDALFAIAYNSNSCVDSILNGVPCFAGDKGTMAWDLCMHEISQITYPEREETLHALAWKQWSTKEMQDGIPQRKLVEIAP